MTARGVKIKTTVLDRGVVVDSSVQHDEDPDRGVVAKTAAAAQRQHAAAVQNVHKGKYG